MGKLKPAVLSDSLLARFICRGLITGIIAMLVVGCGGEPEKTPDTVPPPSANAKPDAALDPNDPKNAIAGPKAVGGESAPSSVQE